MVTETSEWQTAPRSKTPSSLPSKSSSARSAGASRSSAHVEVNDMGLDLGTISASVGLNTAPLAAGAVALDIIKAVLDGKYSGAVNRPRIAGLFDAAKLYTVYVKLPEGTGDLCFGEGTLQDNKVCHRCKGTGDKPCPTIGPWGTE